MEPPSASSVHLNENPGLLRVGPNSHGGRLSAQRDFHVQVVFSALREEAERFI